jgi:hypothetical protein
MESKISDTSARIREKEVHERSQGQTPKRLGGWLIVLAVGMSLSTLRNLNNCLFSLSLLYRQPLWDNLTNPASTVYHPYWKPALIYEAVSNTVIFLISLIMLVFFFQRKKIFPKLIVPVIPTIFVLSLIDYYWAGLIPKVTNSASHTREGQALIVAFIAMHVWIPYFLVSRRVKETFVR